MVTDMIEDNGSRICGSIMKFPRGVNPASEYSEPVSATSTIRDNSNNAPRLSTDPGYMFHNQYGRGGGGYLAKRIMMYGGAFRPPIYTQEQLLPLSRQPRVRTSCVTHPEMISYSAERTSDIDLKKIIHDAVLEPEIHPTLTRHIESPQTQYTTDDFIQDNLLATNVTSGVRARDITLQTNQQCFGTTKIDPLSAYAYTQPCSDKITRDTMLYVMEKPGMQYVHDKLVNACVTPNISGIDREGDKTLVKTYVIEYPRAVRDVVCAPNTSCDVASTMCENPHTLASFVKDDVLNTFNVDSGVYGSGVQAQHLSDAVDHALIKTRDQSDIVYAPAYSQLKGGYEKDVYLHNNAPGRQLEIRQYATNTNLVSENVDEYSITQREAKLQPKVCANQGIENVGYKPRLLQNDGCNYNASCQINDGLMKNDVKRVHFDRNEPLVYG
jgi:hypothetical protein